MFVERRDRQSKAQSEQSQWNVGGSARGLPGAVGPEVRGGGVGRPRGRVLWGAPPNPPLAARARRTLTGITVLENDGVPGLSGTRNTGLWAAAQPVTVFLDDDAEARPGWLRSLTDPYQDANVVATGGHVEPR